MIEYPTRQDLKTLKGIIYLITNTINNKNYVGQTTISFYERYRSIDIPNHNNSHISSIYLKRSLKKHGKDNFTIKLLENNKSIEELNYYEDYYAIKYNCYYPNGYNLTKCGNNKTCSEKSKLKMSKSKRKMFKFTNLNGHCIKTNNLKEFCNLNNLSYACMQKVLSGKHLHHKGYFKIDSNKETVRQRLINKQYKVYQLKNIKTNQIIEFYNISKFVKDNNLHFGKIINLLKGRIVLYLDWTLPITGEDIIKNQREIQEKFKHKKQQIIYE